MLMSMTIRYVMSDVTDQMIDAVFLLSGTRARLQLVTSTIRQNHSVCLHEYKSIMVTACQLLLSSLCG